MDAKVWNLIKWWKDARNSCDFIWKLAWTFKRRAYVAWFGAVPGATLHCRSSGLEQSPQDQCTAGLRDPGSKGTSDEIARPSCSTPNMPRHRSWGCEARSNPDSPRRGGGRGFASRPTPPHPGPIRNRTLCQEHPCLRPGMLTTAGPPAQTWGGGRGDRPLPADCLRTSRSSPPALPPSPPASHLPSRACAWLFIPWATFGFFRRNFSPEARPSWG